MLINGVRVRITICYRLTVLREGSMGAVSEQHNREFADWSRFSEWVRDQNQVGFGVVVECWGLELL